MNRSQVSLIIGDDKLYFEFIKPLSSEKKLMPLIVKLLGSYYYNVEVQQLVDGVSIDSLKEKQEFVSDDTADLRAKLEDIRATTQLFGMLMEDAHTSLEEGMEAVNQFAKATGGTSRSNSEDVSTVPRISMKGVDELHSRKSEEDDKKVIVEDPRYDSLKSDMDALKGDVGKILELLMNKEVSVKSNSESKMIEPEVPKETLVEEPSLIDNLSSATVETTVDEVVESNFVSEMTEEPSDETEEEKSSAEKQEEGLNRLKGLIQGGGIGGFMM